MVEQWRGEGDGANNRSYHRLVNDVMQVWGKFRARLNHSLLGLTPAAINSLDIILTTVVDSSGTDQRDGLTTLHGCCFFFNFYWYGDEMPSPLATRKSEPGLLVGRHKP